MTLNDIYRKGISILKNANIENSSFDAGELFRFVFNLNRQELILNSFDIADNEKAEKYISLVNQRLLGRPLQYILGSWDFMGCSFKIGEGVLIPREDTSAVIRLASKLINPQSNVPATLKVIDLCSGSGIIAVILSKQLKNADIKALEISEKAYGYLCENIKLNHADNVTALKADLFKYHKHFEDEYFDLITSNPPYITKEEMTALQKEVKNEPELALYGGENGLDFYNAIAELWRSKLKTGGICILEIGLNQFKAVRKIFENNNFSFKDLEPDINNIIRAVAFEKL